MTLDEYLYSIKALRILGDEQVEGSLSYNIRWYARRSAVYRLIYYVLVLILIGMNLLSFWLISGHPFPINVASFDLPKTLSFAVAFLLSLFPAFAIKHGWSAFYLAKFKLSCLKDEYDEKLIRVSLLKKENEQKALELAVEATQVLMSKASVIVEEETKGYFSAIKLPTFVPAKNKSS